MKGPVTWMTVKADQQALLAVRSSGKLVNEGRLQIQYPPVLLRLQLDTTLASLWEDGHARASDLWDAFARYPYLPRLRDIDVLLGAVQQGPAMTTWQSEGFATAVADDEASGRYLGLSVGSHPAAVGGSTLLVKPEIALGQLEAEHSAVPLDREHAP